nr:hypothetical protein [Candidatus Sigynarchaeota archaeon]
MKEMTAMPMNLIPPEKVDEIMPPRARDVFKWMLKLKEDIVFVGKHDTMDLYQINIKKDYIQIETNDGETHFREAGNVSDLKEQAEERQPKVTKKFVFVLNIILDFEADNNKPKMIMMSDLAFFYRKKEEDTETDIDSIRAGVKKSGIDVSMNVVEGLGSILDLLAYQSRAPANEFKYGISLLKQDDRIVEILKTYSYADQDFHLELLGRFLAYYGQMIEFTLDFCHENKYLPIITIDTSHPAKPASDPGTMYG